MAVGAHERVHTSLDLNLAEILQVRTCIGREALDQALNSHYLVLSFLLVGLESTPPRKPSPLFRKLRCKLLLKPNLGNKSQIIIVSVLMHPYGN